MTSTDPSSAAPRRPSRQRFGLTARQALATLLVAVVVGLLGGAVELLLDLSRLRGETRDQMAATLELVRPSATEAAFQLNPALAEQVVSGLIANPTIAGVRVSDNFGNVLARRDSPTGTRPGPLARRLFGDLRHQEVDLTYTAPGSTRPEPVGQLEVDLALPQLTARVTDRATTSLIANLGRALLISLVLVALFHLLVTAPLLRLAGAIGRIEPDRPGAHPVPALKGHGGDELGRVVTSLNDLLGASQKGLDERDRARADLEALTRDLEARVAARTADLAREKAETERAFERLDAAHRELDKTNRLMMESIAYARRIQTSWLPDPAALGDAVADIAVRWKPLHLVGGDYYWLERLPDGRALLAVIDCTGHGVPGAFMTMVAASALDRILHEQGLTRPAQVLEEMDRMVRARLRQDRPEAESDDGLEAAVCLWDPRAGTLVFAGVGLPLLYMEGGEMLDIRGARGALGYRSLPAPDRVREHLLSPAPGQPVFLFTDGLPDQMGDESRRLLGRRRLGGILARLVNDNPGKPMADLLAGLEDELAAWRGVEPLRDDLTVIALVPRDDDSAG
ncbi:SpoIIE family protein phosphatase [Roseospirillum parvum]|uniref:Serine phosphatase RsbU, regulator of sigma subunit n=1 Tax=Roseospirillum parvum TaxID=83401 RepID=A0A1G7WN35_9PROT|nr:SpoIIE family protein phosphatase [Roseospirillum parvum]SDG73299.1 Serine phosphatase RsbU, regulator of sigma subunit [Roseospirillum parvum]